MPTLKWKTTVNSKKCEKIKKQEKDVKKRNEYKTAFFLYDLTNIDKQIYDIVKTAMLTRRAYKTKQLLGKYFVFLYLTGSRRTEPFLSKPNIMEFEKNGKTMYRVIKINEKHFEGKEKIHRQKMTQIFMAWNVYEKSLFDFLLDGRKFAVLDFSELLHLKEKDKAYSLEELMNRKMPSVSRAVKNAFKSKITNGDRVEVGGIVPHMLRHTRCYSLWIEKGLPDSLVQRLLGWDSRDLLDYYAYISKSMRMMEMVGMYERLVTAPPTNISAILPTTFESFDI